MATNNSGGGELDEITSLPTKAPTVAEALQYSIESNKRLKEQGLLEGSILQSYSSPDYYVDKDLYDEYAEYTGGYVHPSKNLDAYVYYASSTPELLWRGAVNAFTGIPGEIVTGVGTLVGLGEALTDALGITDDKDNPFDNFLTRLGHGLREAITYKTYDPTPESFSWADVLQKGPEVVPSAVASFIPGIAVTRGVSLLGGGVSRIGKGTRFAQAANATNRALNNRISQSVIGGTINRLVENGREYNDIYQQSYNKSLWDFSDTQKLDKYLNTEAGQEALRWVRDKGLNPHSYEGRQALARYEADRAGALTFKLDLINLGSDIIQFGLISPKVSSFIGAEQGTVGIAERFMRRATRSADELDAISKGFTVGGKALSKGQRQALKVRDAAMFLTEPAGEAVEEGINYIAQREGERLNDIRLGRIQDDGSTFFNRVASYMGEHGFTESAVLGAIGGMAGPAMLRNTPFKNLMGDPKSQEEQAKQRRIDALNSSAAKLRTYAKEIADAKRAEGGGFAPGKEQEARDKVLREVISENALAGNLAGALEAISSEDYKKVLKENFGFSDSEVNEFQGEVLKKSKEYISAFKKAFTGYERKGASTDLSTMVGDVAATAKLTAGDYLKLYEELAEKTEGITNEVIKNTLRGQDSDEAAVISTAATAAIEATMKEKGLVAAYNQLLEYYETIKSQVPKNKREEVEQKLSLNRISSAMSQVLNQATIHENKKNKYLEGIEDPSAQAAFVAFSAATEAEASDLNLIAQKEKALSLSLANSALYDSLVGGKQTKQTKEYEKYLKEYKEVVDQEAQDLKTKMAKNNSGREYVDAILKEVGEENQKTEESKTNAEATKALLESLNENKEAKNLLNDYLDENPDLIEKAKEDPNFLFEIAGRIASMADAVNKGNNEKAFAEMQGIALATQRARQSLSEKGGEETVVEEPGIESKEVGLEKETETQEDSEEKAASYDDNENPDSESHAWSGDIKSEKEIAEEAAEEAEKADIERRRAEEISKRVNDRFSRVEAQQNNLEDNQEAPIKIGTRYNEGMKLKADEVSFLPEGYKGETYKAVTKVIKPQINTDGVMTQSAEVEVGVFESKEAYEKWEANEREKVKKARAKKTAQINAKYDAELAALEEAAEEGPVDEIQDDADQKARDAEQKIKEEKVLADNALIDEKAVVPEAKEESEDKGDQNANSRQKSPQHFSVQPFEYAAVDNFIIRDSDGQPVPNGEFGFVSTVYAETAPAGYLPAYKIVVQEKNIVKETITRGGETLYYKPIQEGFETREGKFLSVLEVVAALDKDSELRLVKHPNDDTTDPDLVTILFEIKVGDQWKAVGTLPKLTKKHREYLTRINETAKLNSLELIRQNVMNNNGVSTLQNFQVTTTDNPGYIFDQVETTPEDELRFAHNHLTLQELRDKVKEKAGTQQVSFVLQVQQTGKEAQEEGIIFTPGALGIRLNLTAKNGLEISLPLRVQTNYLTEEQLNVIGALIGVGETGLEVGTTPIGEPLESSSILPTLIGDLLPPYTLAGKYYYNEVRKTFHILEDSYGNLFADMLPSERDKILNQLEGFTIRELRKNPAKAKEVWEVIKAAKPKFQINLNPEAMIGINGLFVDSGTVIAKRFDGYPDFLEAHNAIAVPFDINNPIQGLSYSVGFDPTAENRAKSSKEYKKDKREQTGLGTSVPGEQLDLFEAAESEKKSKKKQTKTKTKVQKEAEKAPVKKEDKKILYTKEEMKALEKSVGLDNDGFQRFRRDEDYFKSIDFGSAIEFIKRADEYRERREKQTPLLPEFEEAVKILQSDASQKTKRAAYRKAKSALGSAASYIQHGDFKKPRTATEPVIEGLTEAEKQWAIDTFGEDALDVVQRVKTLNLMGEEVYGYYYNSVMTVAAKGARGTIYHEAFHAVVDMHFSAREKSALFKAAEDRYGENTIQELEELLAEDFRKYMQGVEDSSMPKIIREIFEVLKILINKIMPNKFAFDSYFRKIRKGNFSVRNESSKVIMPRRVEGAKAALGSVTYEQTITALTVEAYQIINSLSPEDEIKLPATKDTLDVVKGLLGERLKKTLEDRLDVLDNQLDNPLLSDEATNDIINKTDAIEELLKQWETKYSGINKIVGLEERIFEGIDDSVFLRTTKTNDEADEDEALDNPERPEEQGKIFNQSADERDIEKLRMSPKLKAILESIPKYNKFAEDGILINEVTGLPIYYSTKTTVSLLKNALKGKRVNSFEDVIAKLEEFNQPVYGIIIGRLKEAASKDPYFADKMVSFLRSYNRAFTSVEKTYLEFDKIRDKAIYGIRARKIESTAAARNILNGITARLEDGDASSIIAKNFVKLAFPEASDEAIQSMLVKRKVDSDESFSKEQLIEANNAGKESVLIKLLRDGLIKFGDPTKQVVRAGKKNRYAQGDFSYATDVLSDISEYDKEVASREDPTSNIFKTNNKNLARLFKDPEIVPTRAVNSKNNVITPIWSAMNPLIRMITTNANYRQNIKILSFSHVRFDNQSEKVFKDLDATDDLAVKLAHFNTKEEIDGESYFYIGEGTNSDKPSYYYMRLPKIEAKNAFEELYLPVIRGELNRIIELRGTAATEAFVHFPFLNNEILKEFLNDAELAEDFITGKTTKSDPKKLQEITDKIERAVLENAKKNAKDLLSRVDRNSDNLKEQLKVLGKEGLVAFTLVDTGYRAAISPIFHGSLQFDAGKNATSQQLLKAANKRGHFSTSEGRASLIGEQLKRYRNSSVIVFAEPTFTTKTPTESIDVLLEAADVSEEVKKQARARKKEIEEAYENDGVDRHDGHGYMSMAMWRANQLSSPNAKWDSEMDDIYENWLTRDPKDFWKEIWKQPKELRDRIFAISTLPRKAQYTGPANNTINGSTVSVMIKNSEMPLFPFQTYLMGKDHPLHVMATFLNSEKAQRAGVHFMIPESSLKRPHKSVVVPVDLGLSKDVSGMPQSESGDLLSNTLEGIDLSLDENGLPSLDAGVISLDMSYSRIVQEVEVHGMNAEINPTQHNKVLFNNLDREGFYEVQYTNAAKGEPLTLKGKELQALHNFISANMLEAKLEELMEELGYSKKLQAIDFADIKDQETRDAASKFLLKLQEKLDKSFIKNDKNNNYFELSRIGVDANGNPMFENFTGYPMYKDVIEQSILSLVKKEVMRPGVPGEAAVLTSEFGYSVNDTDFKSTSVVTEDGKTRVVAAECGIPYELAIKMGLLEKGSFTMSKDGVSIDMNKVKKKLVEKLGNEVAAEKALQIIGTRVPTSGINSSMPMTITKIYAPNLRNTIVMPSASLIQIGQDFDIDKVFLTMRSVLRVKGTDKWFLPDSNRKLKEYAAKGETDLKALGEISKEMFFNKKGERFRTPHEAYNVLFDINWAVLTSPKHYPEMVSPISPTAIFGLVGFDPNEVDPSAQLAAESGFSSSTNDQQVKIANDFAKAAVGIISKSITGNAMAKAVGLRLAEPVTILGETYQALDNKYPAEGEENLISYILGALQNTALDDAKDPKLFLMGLNTMTLTPFLAAIRLGMDPKKAFKLVNEKVVKEVHKEMLADRNKSVLSIIKARLEEASSADAKILEAFKELVGVSYKLEGFDSVYSLDTLKNANTTDSLIAIKLKDIKLATDFKTSIASSPSLSQQTSLEDRAVNGRMVAFYRNVVLPSINLSSKATNIDFDGVQKIAYKVEEVLGLERKLNVDQVREIYNKLFAVALSQNQGLVGFAINNQEGISINEKLTAENKALIKVARNLVESPLLAPARKSSVLLQSLAFKKLKGTQETTKRGHTGLPIGISLMDSSDTALQNRLIAELQYFREVDNAKEFLRNTGIVPELNRLDKEAGRPEEKSLDLFAVRLSALANRLYMKGLISTGLAHSTYGFAQHISVQGLSKIVAEGDLSSESVNDTAKRIMGDLSTLEGPRGYDNLAKAIAVAAGYGGFSRLVSNVDISEVFKGEHTFTDTTLKLPFSKKDSTEEITKEYFLPKEAEVKGVVGNYFKTTYEVYPIIRTKDGELARTEDGKVAKEEDYKVSMTLVFERQGDSNTFRLMPVVAATDIAKFSYNSDRLGPGSLGVAINEVLNREGINLLEPVIAHSPIPQEESQEQKCNSK